MNERLDAIEAKHGPVGCEAHDHCLRADLAYLLDLARKQQAALDGIEADRKAMRAREDRLHPFRAPPMCPCKICKPEATP